MSWEITVGEEPETTPTPSSPLRERLIGTAQQEEFWRAITTGDGNLASSARAGSGKSVTSREAMFRALEACPGLSIRYTAFNRTVADEFRFKSPRSVEVGTFHSFCWRALSRALRLREPVKERSYLLLDRLSGGSALKGYVRRSIVKAAGLAKNLAYHPSTPDRERMRFLSVLIDDYDVELWGKPLEFYVDWTDDLLKLSAVDEGSADYDDMLWLAWVHDLEFPVVDQLYIDEAQDLSPVQHALMGQLNPRGRTIPVGDPYQSIYAFRGADSNSMDCAIAHLRAQVLPLTISFRAPQSHAALARRWVPDFEAHPSNREGTIVHGYEDLLDLVAPGDLVICRKNAPIISAALRAIGDRRPAIVRGRSFADGLDSIARRLVADARTVAEFIGGVHRWRSTRLELLAAREGVEDKVEQVEDQAAALEAIGSACQTPAEVCPTIRSLFDDAPAEGRISFSSVHRAKGLEAKRVFLVETKSGPRRSSRRNPSPLAVERERQQARNLSYVAHTRSLDYLAIVAVEDVERRDDEE